MGRGDGEEDDLVQSVADGLGEKGEERDIIIPQGPRGSEGKKGSGAVTGETGRKIQLRDRRSSLCCVFPREKDCWRQSRMCALFHRCHFCARI